MKTKIFRILFLIICILFFVLSLTKNQNIETNLLNAFITPKIPKEIHLSQLANLSAKQLTVLFESNSRNDLDELQTEFYSRLDENFKSLNSQNYSQIIDIYKQYPKNFLTEETKKLIQNNQFETIANKSLQTLYNPFGIYILPPDKDPYFLLSDYVIHNQKFLQNDIQEYGGKFYAVDSFEIQNNEIAKIIELQKELNQNGRIYLTGTPIHSHITAAKSTVEINLICLFSTLALIILCKLYFKTFKILLPIILSIIFGFLSGYCAASAIFENLHVLTFVFSTSLIGISLDYSLHYFLTRDEKGFFKSLTNSMLTTVTAFSILYFSNIEIIKQISVFTSFGLFGVYLFVIIILPLFDFEIKTNNFHEINLKKFKKVIYIFVALTIFTMNIRVTFDNNIKNLYTPQKSLLTAETLYQKVFNIPARHFILISGENIDEILTQEEEITTKLSKKNINTIALSNFIPSSKTQKQNQKLILKLYDKNLNNYAKFLDKNTIQKLKNDNDLKIYNPSDFPLNKKFMLDENTTFIITENYIKLDGSETINIADDISQILIHSQGGCMLLFPFVFVILFVFLCMTYNFKNAIKIILPPLCGALFALGIVSCLQSINLFHIIALFLIIGFSLDYAIFRLNGTKNSNDAILISCISTAFSFLLLSFTSFKLISSLGLILFLGITSSYILSLLLISPNDETLNI